MEARFVYPTHGLHRLFLLIAGKWLLYPDSRTQSNCVQGRSDLANAKIAGLDEDLNLTAKDYSNAANMFLIGYIVFQLPGTLLVKKIGPPLQFGGAMFMVRLPNVYSPRITDQISGVSSPQCP